MNTQTQASIETQSEIQKLGEMLFAGLSDDDIAQFLFDAGIRSSDL